MKTYLCLVLVGSLVSTSVVDSAGVIYDESVWTKSAWHTWKMDNALLGVNPTDEGTTLSALSLLSGANLNSLDGPFPRQFIDPKKRLVQGIWVCACMTDQI